MAIVRFLPPDGDRARIGILVGDAVTDLPDVTTLAQLWRLPSADLRALTTRSPSASTWPATDVRLLAPVDGTTEVWACGVTYQISREARMEESERAASVYDLVYDADRPEIFFKSVAWRVRGPGEEIGIRTDSQVDVPEPELALVVNRFGEIVGYTICDDVSSRTIEGANPLYLPQAKVYAGSCALGPAVTPVWEIADPYDLSIELSITRDGALAWHGQTSTALLHRKFDDLAAWLLRGDVHPDGVVLSTGTGLVPATPFTLRDGDRVAITIPKIGTLANDVRRGLPSVH